MNPVFSSALWITLIGMSLVFIAILLLWGLMEVVMRLTAQRRTPEPQVSQAESGGEAAPPADQTSLKHRAAAAAVAAAAALRKGKPGTPYTHATGKGASAWQAVTRSMQLNQRGQSFSRKSRGKS